VRQRPEPRKVSFFSAWKMNGSRQCNHRARPVSQQPLLLASEKFLAIEGILQNQDNVISVKAERVLPLFVTKAEHVSHDFHEDGLSE